MRTYPGPETAQFAGKIACEDYPRAGVQAGDIVLKEGDPQECAPGVCCYTQVTTHRKHTMTTTSYSTTTVKALKADIFDAIRQGDFISTGDACTYAAFDVAIDAFVGCSGVSLSPKAVPAARTRRAWLNELHAE